ncbi:hypothetical protein MTO96_000222 [Rhipicephalus appendiculatus]
MPNSNPNAPSYADSIENASTNFSLQLTGRVGGGEDSITVFGPQYHGQVRITIILIMIAFSVTGNSVVCWRLLRNHRRRRYQKAHVLFLNLAVADLLVTTVTMTSQTVWEIMGRAWIAGDAFCRIFKVLQTFALASSTYVIVAIALDRHFAIVHPLASCPTPSRLAAAAWVASLLPSLPNLYVFRLVDAGAGINYCASLFYTNKTVSPLARQLYMTSVFMAVFVLPLILLVALYGRILAEIWHQSSALKNRHQTTSSLPKAKVKTVKLTAAIFAAFLVTNVPYMIQELALAVRRFQRVPGPKRGGPVRRHLGVKQRHQPVHLPLLPKEEQRLEEEEALRHAFPQGHRRREPRTGQAAPVVGTAAAVPIATPARRRANRPSTPCLRGKRTGSRPPRNSAPIRTRSRCSSDAREVT